MRATTLADACTGRVLDLPSGSEAISPPVCVTAAYAQVRSLVADVAGRNGVSVSIEFQRGGAWRSPRNMGMEKAARKAGWSVSRGLHTHTAGLRGATLARFILKVAPSAHRRTQEYDMYDFYVDPRCAH